MTAGSVGNPVQPCPLKKKKPGRIQLEIVDEDNKPFSGVRYRIELPDETVVEGVVGKGGQLTIEDVEPGACKLSFPNLDSKTWDLA